MKDYNEYTVSEFVLDDSFRRWVLKNSPSERSFWEKWQLDHPHQHENISKAREFVLKMHRSHELLSDDELKEALNQLSEARNRENVFVKPLLNRISRLDESEATAPPSPSRVGIRSHSRTIDSTRSSI